MVTGTVFNARDTVRASELQTIGEGSEDEKKDNESEDESVSINSSEFYADDKVDADSVSSQINGNVKDDMQKTNKETGAG